MLENTLYCLTKKKKLNVAYFGGSITFGEGASCYDKCWAGRMNSWFREQYPDCEVNGIQAAICGTGSTFGAFRCDTDVCAYNPDLVFIEYACNDYDVPFMEVSNNFDAILRKIWKSNPFADIVMIYVSVQFLSDWVSSGIPLEARAAMSAVSYYYGDIPQIDVGEVLRHRIISEGVEWIHYTKDTVHPLDAGYEIYAETIQKRLTDYFEKAEKRDAPIAKQLPKPLFGDNSRIGAQMIDAYTASLGDGWSKTEKSFCDRYPHYIESHTPGSSLEFTFTGTRCDLFWMRAEDSGDFVYSFDDGPETTLRSWDSGIRVNSVCLSDGLLPGKHTLKLRVAETKDERSAGNAIRIAAFLVV